MMKMVRDFCEGWQNCPVWWMTISKNTACETLPLIYFNTMTTIVNSKNMVTIPVEIARRFGVKLGFSFDWFATGKPDEISIRVIPDRRELSRRLKGAGKIHSPERDSVSELVNERSEDLK
jgi:bifunctional DNA-binding transcriptional regulator/antitoxin component of YhaV-PrlF toxin-antitoxin module